MMDDVQKFISKNQYQLGYIMQEASRQWVEKDPVGALTVGDCNFVIQKHGQYHELLETVEEQQKEIKRLQGEREEHFQCAPCLADEAMEKENARLREALEYISTIEQPDGGYVSRIDVAVTKARQALEETS